MIRPEAGWFCTMKRQALYRHGDGSQELVDVLRVHPEINAVTIFLPSTGRERQTEHSRLTDPCEDGDNSSSDHSESPEKFSRHSTNGASSRNDGMSDDWPAARPLAARPFGSLERTSALASSSSSLSPIHRKAHTRHPSINSDFIDIDVDDGDNSGGNIRDDREEAEDLPLKVTSSGVVAFLVTVASL